MTDQAENKETDQANATQDEPKPEDKPATESEAKADDKAEAKAEDKPAEKAEDKPAEKPVEASHGYGKGQTDWTGWEMLVLAGAMFVSVVAMIALMLALAPGN
jgi:hypothetical protein